MDNIYYNGRYYSWEDYLQIAQIDMGPRNMFLREHSRVFIWDFSEEERTKLANLTAQLGIITSGATEDSTSPINTWGIFTGGTLNWNGGPFTSSGIIYVDSVTNGVAHWAQISISLPNGNVDLSFIESDINTLQSSLQSAVQSIATIQSNVTNLNTSVTTLNTKSNNFAAIKPIANIINFTQANIALMPYVYAPEKKRVYEWIPLNQGSYTHNNDTVIVPTSANGTGAYVAMTDRSHSIMGSARASASSNRLHLGLYDNVIVGATGTYTVYSPSEVGGYITISILQPSIVERIAVNGNVNDITITPLLSLTTSAYTSLVNSNAEKLRYVTGINDVLAFTSDDCAKNKYIWVYGNNRYYWWNPASTTLHDGKYTIKPTAITTGRYIALSNTCNLSKILTPSYLAMTSNEVTMLLHDVVYMPNAGIINVNTPDETGYTEIEITEPSFIERTGITGSINDFVIMPVGGNVTTLDSNTAVNKATTTTFAQLLNSIALPKILGGYDIIFTMASGAHPMGDLTDQLTLRGYIGGNIIITAANVLTQPGTNQTTEIVYAGNGHIDAIGLHCNLFFDSIKFTTFMSYNNILTNLKGVGKVTFRHCYFDFDLGELADSVVAFCEGMDVVFDGCSFRESSTVAAQNSSIVELSRGTRESRGSRVTMIDCVGVNSRPFAYGAKGIGEAVYSNSSTAYAEEASTTDNDDIIVLTNQAGTIPIDIPVVSNVSMTSQCNLSGQCEPTINARFNMEGTIYWAATTGSSVLSKDNIISGSELPASGSYYTEGGATEIIASETIIGLLNLNTLYRIWIFGRDVYGNDSMVTMIQHTTASKPLLATPVAGTPTVNSATAITVPISGVDQTYTYAVEAQYKASSSGTWLVASSVLDPSITSYQYTGLTGGTSYDFRFFANGNGTSHDDSLPSNTVTAQTQTVLTNMLSSVWNVSGGVTANGGGSFSFDDVTNGDLYQYDADMILSLELSTSYTLTFDVTGSVYMRLATVNEGNGAVTLLNYSEYTAGSKTVTFTTGTNLDDGGFRFQFTTDGESGTVSNIILLPTT